MLIAKMSKAIGKQMLKAAKTEKKFPLPEFKFQIAKPAPKTVIRKAIPQQPNTHYGKHKIKRYLYHLTSEDNYKKMVESGKIKLTQDSQLPYDGIFMTDLENLAKQWRTSKDWNHTVPENKSGIFLSAALLKQAAKGGDTIVCLRIPTKYLNHDMLKIRSQNRLFSEVESPKIKEHIRNGAPAKDANLYKQRKEAIEYIYQEEIPIDKVELAGTSPNPRISINDMEIWTFAQQRKVIADTLRNIFQNSPEAKGLDSIV